MRIYSLQLPLLLFSFVILGTSLDCCTALGRFTTQYRFWHSGLCELDSPLISDSHTLATYTFVLVLLQCLLLRILDRTAFKSRSVAQKTKARRGNSWRIELLFARVYARRSEIARLPLLSTGPFYHPARSVMKYCSPCAFAKLRSHRHAARTVHRDYSMRARPRPPLLFVFPFLFCDC